MNTEASTTETAKDAKFDEEWDHYVAGLERAVEWVKNNKKFLRHFSHYISPCSRHGVCIELGALFASSSNYAERRKALGEMFRYKRVKRVIDECNNEERYTLLDDELLLSFAWSVWRTRKCVPRESEITL